MKFTARFEAVDQSNSSLSQLICPACGAHHLALIYQTLARCVMRFPESRVLAASVILTGASRRTPHDEPD